MVFRRNSAYIKLIFLLVSLFVCLSVRLWAQESANEVTVVEDEVDAELVANPLQSELVEVNWLEEMIEGGITMVALGIISVALLAFMIERYFTLQRKRFVPPALLKKVRPLYFEGRYDEIRQACKKAPSAMSEIIVHCVDYRTTHFDLLQEGVSDIGGRYVVDQEEKCNPLSVIAGVAPLLGLLGTMIGMIESFKLVEVFGDEGGASLLAGSISKALITTAVGLILAIPALLAFHWSRRRVHQIGNAIEIESETLLRDWFLIKADEQYAQESGLDEDAEEELASVPE